MKLLGFACTLFINLIIIKSIRGQTKNFVIGYCDSSNAAVIYQETVTVFNNRADKIGWFGRLWNWVTFSSDEATTLKIRKILPPHGNYQNCNITCIRFADLVRNGTGGVGKVNSGGIGRNFVDLELTSQPGKGMIFNVALNGYCNSPYNQSITNGTQSNQNVGWKWTISNISSSSPTLPPNQGPGWRFNLTSGNSNSSVYQSRPSSSELALGWRPENSDRTNLTRPSWVVPSNISISITSENGYNKPLNISYGAVQPNGSYPNRFPIPSYPNLPSNYPSSNDRLGNTSYGWNNNVSNSSERDSRNGWRSY